MARLRKYVGNMPRRQPADDTTNAIDPCNGLIADRFQRWATGRHPAAMHDDKLIGKFRGQIEIVQDGENQPAAACKIPRRFQHGDLVADIETCGGLIEEERPCLAIFNRVRYLRQRPRKLHPLLLAA